MWLGLHWWFWVGLFIVVIIFRLTIARGRASLRHLRPERREMTEKERRAFDDSPFRNEPGHSSGQSSQQS